MLVTVTRDSSPCHHLQPRIVAVLHIQQVYKRTCYSAGCFVGCEWRTGVICSSGFSLHRFWMHCSLWTKVWIFCLCLKTYKSLMPLHQKFGVVGRWFRLRWCWDDGNLLSHWDRSFVISVWAKTLVLCFNFFVFDSTCTSVHLVSKRVRLKTINLQHRCSEPVRSTDKWMKQVRWICIIVGSSLVNVRDDWNWR